MSTTAMQTLRPIVLVLALLTTPSPTTAAVTTTAVRQGGAAPAASAGAAVAPVPLSSEFELLDARPFVLEEPYVHTWRAEQPLVGSGWVLVLRAPLERIRPRQTAEPVLYVGAQTAERVNAPPFDTPGAGELGQLVVLVPAPLDAEGKVALDPWSVPVFLGTEALPEDVDAARIVLELDRAARLGLGPPRRPVVAPGAAGASGATGGASRRPSAGVGRVPTAPVPLPALRLHDRAALDLELASLIAFWSPEELDLVNGLRTPVGR